MSWFLMWKSPFWAYDYRKWKGNSYSELNVGLANCFIFKNCLFHISCSQIILLMSSGKNGTNGKQFRFCVYMGITNNHQTSVSISKAWFCCCISAQLLKYWSIVTLGFALIFRKVMRFRSSKMLIGIPLTELFFLHFTFNFVLCIPPPNTHTQPWKMLYMNNIKILLSKDWKIL